jgi:hypothetical protein
MMPTSDTSYCFSSMPYQNSLNNFDESKETHDCLDVNIHKYNFDCNEQNVIYFRDNVLTSANF